MSQAFPWYTARGDDGTTGLLGAGRVPKYHPQPEAFGAVDEAGSMIGYARALVEDDEINDLLVQVQRHCYDLMAELAATPDAQAKFRRIDTEQVNWLAEVTDRFGQQVAMPREFVVPGDTQADAALDMARTVVRRAERRVSQLLVEKMIENPALVGYLNRLSSLLFVLGAQCQYIRILHNHLNRLSSLLFVLGRYMVAKTGQDTMTFAKQRSK